VTEALESGEGRKSMKDILNEARSLNAASS
jgi:hypothetical protein